MKKLFVGVFAVCATALVWAAQYQVATFFDGTPVTAVSGVSLLSTNSFLGYLPGGGRTAVLGGTLGNNSVGPYLSSVLQSNGWTKKVLVPAATAGLSFGFKCAPGTNYVTLSDAGSNDANGPYFYAPAAGDTFGSRYTNGLAHALVKLGAVWCCTNAQGLTNYTAAAVTGPWVVKLPGITPTPTSAYSDVVGAAGTMTILSLAKSYDGSNWTSFMNLTNNANNSTYTGTNVPITLTDYAYLTVYAATNGNTNGAAITNAYLRAYYR